MFKNNLKIAWRNFLKNRQFAILNLIGLSTALASALLIFLWVNDERQVDKFNQNDSRLFEVMANISLGDGIHTQEYTPGLLAKALKDEMPEVDYAVSVVPGFGKDIVASGNQQIKAMPQWADKDFFNAFSYPLIKGNKDQVLTDEYAVLLSDELAMKLFHSTDILGKTIKWANDKEPYTITGIFKKPAVATTATFDLLFNYRLFFDRDALNEANWQNNGPVTYVVLRQGANAGQFSNKIAGFTRLKNSKSLLTLFLRKFSDKYLYGNFENGKQAGGRIAYVRLFSVVAIFILIIACINFMNLSTAKAANRSKEVGVKKVVGASRQSLIFQYLGESLLMSFFSLLLALGLVFALLPEFNRITGKKLSFNFNADILLAVCLITCFTGLVAGSYPAFYLSKFNPVTVLKGKFSRSITELLMRKGLVIFQFTISVIFIVSVLVVLQQMNFIRSKNLGYNKDNVIVFSNEGQVPAKFQPFMTELKNLPGVLNATSFGDNLTGGHGGTGNLNWEGKKSDQKIEFSALAVDYGFTQTLGLKMAEGRAFSKSYGSDSSKIIFNQAAIKAMGLKDPIGKTVKAWGNQYQIIGVIKDFHFESLYEKIKPCFLRVFPNNANIVVKISAGSEKETLSKMQGLYAGYNQGLPFEYRFLDEDYQALYASEERVAVLFQYFAAMAIVISCLGMFGLAAFTAQNRQKEIGIRKVVGASINNMVLLLSKDFMKLVFIAVLIAFPLAWWVMNTWLSAFAYRVSLGPGIFVSTFFAIVIIALLTVSYQSIKAAFANPVKSLSGE
jgi:ABC-type antimicrobial peptide transport system permease subunit